MLAAPTDADWVAQVTRTLHGKALTDPDRVAALLARSSVVDGLISRMMRTPKALDRMSKIVDRLANPNAVGISRMIEANLAPLGDPDQPYLYKLRELAGADPETNAAQPVAARLCGVLDLLALLRKAVPERPDSTVTEGLARGDVALLGRYLEAEGAKGLDRLFPKPPDGLGGAQGIVIAGALQKALGLASLSGPTLRALQVCADHLATVPLPPRAGPGGGYRVECLGGEGGGWWSAQAGPDLVEEAPTDSVDAGHLMLTTAARPHPATLAYLGRLPKGAAPVNLAVAEHDGSWARDIQGYGAALGLTRCGVFRPPGSGDAAPTATLELVPAEGRDAGATANFPLDSCYAVLVRLDQTVDVGAFVNADRCRVIDGLEGLLDLTDAIPDVALRKPVVLLGRRTPANRTHVTDAVQCHWRYGGLYPTAPALARMDGMTGQIRLDGGGAHGLGRATLAELVSLPLEDALGLARDADRMARLSRGLFVLTDGLIVRDPSADPDAMPAALERAINNAPLTGADREAVFLSEAIDLEAFDAAEIIANWPLANTIAAEIAMRRDLRRRIADVARHPELTAAEAVLTELGAPDFNRPLPDGFDAFASAVTARADILLAMDPPLLKTLFELVRQSPAMDAAAANVAVWAGEICERHADLVIPTFELLAAGLDEAALNASLTFAVIRDTDSKRIRYRLTESLRRYATPDTLFAYLHHVARTDPETIQDPPFARMFKSLLADIPRNRLTTTLEPEQIAALERSVDLQGAFSHAMVAGDEVRMHDLLMSGHRLQDEQAMKWLDTLRGHSNELRAAGIATNQITAINMGNLHLRKLTAAIVSDPDGLAALRDGGLLDDPSDLSVVGRNILGDNGPLNTMLTELGARADAAPLHIEGDTIHSVFANAARTVMPRAQGKGDGPLVSVVISAFEPDMPLLEASLDSILNQSHRATEVFVVDDANTDPVASEIAALVARHDDRVQYIRMAENSGPYLGRNEVLAACKGAFVAIQDADDWSHPDRFAAQLDCFAADPLLQLVTTPHIRIDRAGHVQFEARFAILGDGPMTSMFRRDVFDTLGPFARVRSRGDVEMRERVRSYFGPHALQELAAPMMLCFADSATLSQRTKQDRRAHLQLFRTNIGHRPDLRGLRALGEPVASVATAQVPRALRAPRPEELS